MTSERRSLIGAARKASKKCSRGRMRISGVEYKKKKGQNWIKNFLTQVKKEEELQKGSLRKFGSERAIQEGESK